MSKAYKTNNYEDAVVLKAALCSRYPDAADAINDIYKMSDDGWVDTVTEDEDKGMLMFHGLIEGAPTDWTIDFSGELIIDEVEEMEDDTMKNVNDEVAVTVEEVTMGEKAKAFAEGAKEKLADGFKFVTENVDVAADEVKKMANMSDKDLEEHLKTNGKVVLDKIVNAVKKYSGKMKDASEFFPNLKNRADKADNIVELIKEVLDEEELNGWGKFKAIVKELIKWLLRLLLKVGAIVLKIAFTLVVGAVKIGATTLVTAGKALGVVNKEVVKPTVKAGKTAWNNHKERKAAKEAETNDIERQLFNNYEGEFED